MTRGPLVWEPTHAFTPPGGIAKIPIPLRPLQRSSNGLAIAAVLFAAVAGPVTHIHRADGHHGFLLHAHLSPHTVTTAPSRDGGLHLLAGAGDDGPARYLDPYTSTSSHSFELISVPAEPMIVAAVRLVAGSRVVSHSFCYAHAPPLIDFSPLRAPPAVSPA